MIKVKSYETRLRRIAERRGLRLVKSRRRDPRALDYEHFWIINVVADDALVLGGDWGATLDEVEEFLKA